MRVRGARGTVKSKISDYKRKFRVDLAIFKKPMNNPELACGQLFQELRRKIYANSRSTLSTGTLNTTSSTQKVPCFEKKKIDDNIFLTFDHEVNI